MKRSNPTASKPLAFFGTAEFSLPILESLIEQGFDLALAVTKPDKPSGRGRETRAPIIKTVAESHGIPVIQPASKDELLPLLEAYEVDMGVVVSFGMILPAEVIDFFSGGLVNVHASLLPKWRGPSPIEAAILAGDNVSGVSIMRLEERMDAGPVYGFAEMPLAPEITQGEAYEELSQLGAETLTALLPGIINGEIDPIPQDEDSATYCKLIKKADGAIDWSKPALEIERQIRAYLGWPGSYGKIAGLPVTVTKVELLPTKGPAGKHFITESKELAVYCGQDALIVKSIKPAGKREMSGKDFLHGYLK